MFDFLKRRNKDYDESDRDSVIGRIQINSNSDENFSAPILNPNFDLISNNGSIHAASIANTEYDLSRKDDLDLSFAHRSLRTIPGVFCPVALSMLEIHQCFSIYTVCLNNFL